MNYFDIIITILAFTSVVSFALPMVIGIISGCYSSICIASPLWVMWRDYKDKHAKHKPNKKK